MDLFTAEQLVELEIKLTDRAENLTIADYARLANWLADNPPCRCRNCQSR